MSLVSLSGRAFPSRKLLTPKNPAGAQPRHPGSLEQPGVPKLSPFAGEPWRCRRSVPFGLPFMACCGSTSPSGWAQRPGWLLLSHAVCPPE